MGRCGRDVERLDREAVGGAIGFMLAILLVGILSWLARVAGVWWTQDLACGAVGG